MADYHTSMYYICGLVLAIWAMKVICYYLPPLWRIHIITGLNYHFTNQCVNCMSWDGTSLTACTITIKIAKLQLHLASSVHIPCSVNNFQNVLLSIRLSPLGSPILRKYTKPYNAFKRRGMYPNVSKCNAKRCVCCTHLCTTSTFTSSANGIICKY